MKLMNKRILRRVMIALAFAGTAVAGGQGVAHAVEEDYPPVPNKVADETPVPNAPAGSPDDSDEVPAGGGTLPQTGGPGTTSILLAGGAAVVAGVAITGFAARRREGDLGAA